jgi:hypothetical protein
MAESLLTVAHEEIISLVNQGVEECETGNMNTGVSIFLEAQFLLGELIEHQLNNLPTTSPLIPLMDDCVDDGGVPSRNLQDAE